MPCSSRTVGGYVASETSVVQFGRYTRPLSKGVLYLQGSHGVADNFLGDPSGQVLGNGEFVTICGDLSQTTSQGTYGNNTAITRVGQLKTFVQSTSSPVQAASGKVHILAGSGGAAAGINWARQNPTLVASMYLTAPLCNLQDLYENRFDATVTQAEINAAYGGNVAASYATNDPSATGNQAALAGVPIKIAYSTDDPYIPQSIVFAYRTLVNSQGGAIELVSQGAVGHSANGLDRADVVAFFANHP